LLKSFLLVLALSTLFVSPVVVGAENQQPLLAGSYSANQKDNALRSIQLTGQTAKPTNPLGKQKYYRYRAVRGDGKKDAGVWWLVTYAKGDGYLMLESKKSDFPHGKRLLQFAIYQVEKNEQLCLLSTRPAHGKKWNRKPMQTYSRSGCPRK